MKRHIRRLIIALVVSVSCFAYTRYWYAAGRVKHVSGDKVPVARLTEASNEVQRKEVKRVIWEVISRNEELYPGEAIRTMDKAEASIQLKSGTRIHLEPDSLVVLEQNENGLALDFLRGNLFVQAQSTGTADNLSLKTNAGEIKLNSAELSMSKDASGQVALEVHKGQAELKQSGKTVALAKDHAAVLSDKGLQQSEERVQILSPHAGETVLLNVAQGERLEFTWKPLGPEYKVSVDVGASRGSLARLPDASADGPAGKLSLKYKPGKWFWRLHAQSSVAGKPALASFTIPVVIQPKTPPALVEPASDALVVQLEPTQIQEFRWLNRHVYSSQLFELSTDPRFTKITKKEALTPETTTLQLTLPAGKYYWRVTGYLPVKGKTEGLASSPRALTLTASLELKAPNLLGPANFAQMSFAETQRAGVSLRWESAPNLKRVHVLAQRKTEGGWQTLVDADSETTTTKLTDVRPGAYQWRVTTLDPKGGTGKASETFEFSVDDMPKVEWLQGDAEEQYLFTTAEPTLVAQWKAPVGGATSYRVRLVSADEGAETADWQTTSNTRLELKLKGEGKYNAFVEGLNARGVTVAASGPKAYVVKRLPLLPAPRWAEGTPPTLKSDGKGNLSLNWLQVDGAATYMMILKDEAGRVLEERASAQPRATLNRLKPGQYQVELKSVDLYRRPSAVSEPRAVNVPNSSDIRAPKIKAMKVN